MATEIPHGTLRNQIGAILRRAQSGEHFTVTVNGRPTAELGPQELRDARTAERAAVGEV